MIRRSLLVLLLLSSIATADEPPIPQLALWESHMLSFGATHCVFMQGKDPNSDSALGDTYYDATRVYHQIGNYVGPGSEASWRACAESARVIYGDNYIIENGGGQGYWNFSEGLRIDYELNSTQASLDAVVILATNMPYCVVGYDYSQIGAGTAREVSYCLNALMNYKALGGSVDSRITTVKTELLSYIDEWFVSETYRCGTVVPYNPCDPVEATGKYYIQPFMVGLVTDALIRYWKVTADAAVEPAITTALDWINSEAWVAADNSWWYDNWKDNPGDAWPAKVGSPDLNLLIVPSMAWLYTRTSDTDYRDRADAAFAKGVTNAYLGGTKQFNQNYQMSFDYVTYRQEFDPPIDPPQSTTINVSLTDTVMVVSYGAVGLPYEANCTVTLNDSGGTPITTATTTEGLAKRQAIFTGRTASTVYGIAVDCDGTVADYTNTQFTTKATPAGGNRTVPIQSGDPKVIANVARATVRYDDNAALSSPATVQNTSCANGCTINLTLAAGLWYYRWEWQSAADAVLATGAVQTLLVQ